MSAPVFRFAPSPNGRLHLGHAYSALLNADFARRFSGRLLLRIEDIDRVRCRPVFEEGIYDDLAWLGLRWEEPVRRQSEHLNLYRAVARDLRGMSVLYPCFCSRKDIAETAARRERVTGMPRRDPDGALLYPETCKALDASEARRRIEAGETHAWRIDMVKAEALAGGSFAYRRVDRTGSSEPVEACPARWGDAVIVRKDVPASYHLSVVVDDALQGISHVVRGKDLEAATDLHVLLQVLLRLPTPLYHHHDLVRDDAGDKLSKSRQSEALADLRARGVTAAEVRERLGF